MKVWIKNLWSHIRTSFWFVPSLMVLGAGGLSFASIYLDKYLNDSKVLPAWMIYHGSLPGARTILSTIAGSMITVAGVTFSITIVALTLTSSQLGPRLLRNFIRDRKNQIVLGTFIATYIYCLGALWNFRGSSDIDSITSISITFAMILAMASVGVLIFFIHHISVSIQADQVIALVFTDLEKTFKKKFSGENDSFQRKASIEKEHEDYKHNNKQYDLALEQSGYIKDVDIGKVFNFAKKNSAVVAMKHRSGDYIVPDSKVLAIYTKQELDKEKIILLKECFILGNVRATDKDIEFAFNQIVEIAIRALSPGINDPFTAITCIDRLSTALLLYIDKANEMPYIYDKDNNLRVIEDLVNFRDIVDASFNQIRQASSAKPAVLMRILERLKDLSLKAEKKAHKDVLTEHAGMIKNTAYASVKEKRDLRDIDRRYNNLLESLE